MALIPEYIDGNFYGSHSGTLKGVRVIMGIKNTGTQTQRIDQVRMMNVSNNVINPGYSNVFDFAFSIPDKYVSYSTVNQDSLELVQITPANKIKYSIKNFIEPGNNGYESYGLLSSPYNYRFRNSFDLEAEDVIYFAVLFAPNKRVRDYYRARLVINFHTVNTNVYESLTHDVTGDFVYNINEIDNKQTPEEVMVINGIPFGGIVNIQ